jgi:LacI family transcriptional regulator
MKDIAEELGISVASVSKVFNNHADIGAETRKRVLRRMKELNYQPSLHAQGLASGRTLMVGLIVPDLVHAFFSEIAKSISESLRKGGFGLVISSSDEEPELERQEIEQMLRRRVDVLILASCQSDAKSLARVNEQKVPLILIDREFPGFEASFIGTNDVLVGEMATEHLVATGRRRIAHIGGQQVSTSKGRLEGYRKTLARHGIVVPAKYVVRRRRGDESGDKTGQKAMEKLLRLKPRPDAVFCYNDPAAVGAMNAILAAGLRIPEDIAIVGCGNMRYAESFRVPLSSVDVSRKTFGEHAGALALELAAHSKARRQRTIIVRPNLVVRESSGAARVAGERVSPPNGARQRVVAEYPASGQLAEA